MPFAEKPCKKRYNVLNEGNGHLKACVVPVKLTRLEESIYLLRLWDHCTVPDLEAVQKQAEASWKEYSESVRVIIIERDDSTSLKLSFSTIRRLISRQNMQDIYMLHILPSTQIRIVISTLNSIFPMKIEPVDDLDSAIIRAREILRIRRLLEEED